jgi:rhomboid protease GluP
MQQLRFFLRQISYTQILVAINVFLFLISSILGLFIGNNLALLILGAESLPLVASGEIWRVVTHAFLHVNIIHLLFNMYALWHLGDFVERFFGKEKLIIVYVFSSITASLASMAINFLTAINSTDSISYLSVGASGAIFGILGLILGNVVRSRHYGNPLPIDINQLYLIVGINLLFGFSFSGINNAAHIGGLVGGFLLSFVIEQSITFDLPNWKKLFVKTAFPMCILIVFLSFLAQVLSIVLQLSITY